MLLEDGLSTMNRARTRTQVKTVLSVENHSLHFSIYAIRRIVTYLKICLYCINRTEMLAAYMKWGFGAVFERVKTSLGMCVERNVNFTGSKNMFAWHLVLLSTFVNSSWRFAHCESCPACVCVCLNTYALVFDISNGWKLRINRMRCTSSRRQLLTKSAFNSHVDSCLLGVALLHWWRAALQT